MSGPFFDDDDGFKDPAPDREIGWDPSDHDGIIAERFELLDRLTPPPVHDITDHTPPQAASNAAPYAERRSPLFALLAAAAALLVVVGLSIGALQGGEEGVEAIDLDDAAPADQPSVLDDAGRATGELSEAEDGRNVDSDGSAEGNSGQADETAEDESTPDGTVQDPADGDGDADGDADGDTDGPDQETGDSGTGGSAEASSTTSNQPDSPDQPTDETTATDSPTTTIPSTDTTSTDPENPDTTESGNGNGPVTVIRGIATEVFTDCRSHLVLTEDGTVENVSPISCDGGSYIVVDGRRIQTSAGFVPTEDYFDKHPEDLMPGDSVMVQAREHDGGLLSLDCQPCSVRSR